MTALRNKVSLIGKVRTMGYQDAAGSPHTTLEIITIEQHLLNDGTYGPILEVVHQVDAFNHLATRMNAMIHPHMEVIIEGRLMPYTDADGKLASKAICTEFLIISRHHG
jgi:hypothetical protein